MSGERDVLERVERIGIVPVVVVDDPAHGAPLAEALLAGGIACAEFTMRTPAGLGALQAAARVEGFLAGAGTVLTPSQVDAVAAAGARLLVTPGYAPSVNARAREHGVVAVPGVATPTEVQRAREDGYSHVKLFPAASLGGPAYVDALAAPFADVRFLPSGGLTPENLGAYLQRPSVFAGSGSWMVPRAAIAEGDFRAIRELARACRDLCDAVRNDA
ncbi:bifunctional 4-hydroxy-2-oxoglutarate aldolase/2-dehydro-3-deoxy-phosphogluconate aldolase [Microbacterium sp. PA5]|uniref:bifunctional 4-hydroxy-2-oxoglutarate aldolase/2-dehydro-3-deoxy-phosphogluconate aldolase n=1 Tax=Microbacterium sp. PA5 TaxID=3416654 RepID=UPI003CF94E83